MAGAAGSWYKTGAGAKRRVFISKETIRASLGGDSVTEAELAAARANLVANPDRYSTMIATLAGASPQPAGQAKRAAAPAGSQIPQRAKAERDALEQKMIRTATDEWNKRNPDNRITDTEARRRIQGVLDRIVAETELATMATPQILDRILDSGFQNQHTTNTSGATLDPARRAEAEHNMFGIPKDSPPDAFPIYGFLGLRSGEVTGIDGIDGLYVYGSAKITFNEDVRKRTTMSVDDSLYEASHQRLMPTPLEAPGIASVDNNAGILLEMHNRPTADIMNEFSYIEAQIHGPTTASDIGWIDFGPDDPPSWALRDRLDDLGISWTIGGEPGGY